MAKRLRDRHLRGQTIPRSSVPLGVCPLVAVEAGVCRDVLLQEFHLIDEDASIGEDEEFRAVRHVGRIQQLHVRFLGRAAAFLLVAVAARGDDVHPRVAAAARHRQDVVAGQLEVGEVAAAEAAEISSS